MVGIWLWSWPAVVLAQRGPWIRGVSWGWAPAAQFLASRGYRVIEPEFRGSLGYGQACHRRAFKQWGLAMQDDLTDATRWAVDNGLVDAKRIVGASHGGYAALMGVVREPALYRAAVSWIGPTDIARMSTCSASDMMGSLWLRDAFAHQVAM